MNPLARKGIELALVDELRLCADGSAPTKAFMRQALGCSMAELAAAIQSLRYQGKVMWDRLALSPSMLAGEEPAQFPAAAPIAVEGGAAAAKVTSPPSIASGPDDEEDQGVNDSGVEQPVARQAHNLEDPPVSPSGGRAAAADGSSPAPATGSSFVPPKLLHAAGVHAANTRAAGKAMPAPQHEPEIARQVREEVNERMGRRARARSTGTVRVPLEIRKFAVPDLNMSEAIGCMLTEEPLDVLRAVSRKHPTMWRRCVLLSRIRGERPIQTLYAALQQGLGELEQGQSEVSDVA